MREEELAELRRQQLHDVLQSGRTAALLSMLGVTVAAVVFREVLSVPAVWLSPAMVAIAATVTLILARRWRDPFDDGRDTAVRLSTMAALTGLSGLGWGLLLYTGFDGAVTHDNSIAMYALLFAVLFSLILSVMTLYSSYLPAIIAFALPVLAGGVSFGASYDDRTLLLTATVFTVISLALAVVARSRYAHYREFVILKTNNEKLLRAYREQKEIAESSSRAKSRFLAAASHDLRQPIHAIGLLSDTLESQAEQPHIKVLSQSITESVNDLTALLEVILDISRIDAGLIRPVVTSFPINRLFFNLHKTFVNAAYHKSLRFRVRNSSLLVRSDAILLERILTNLVSNAVKYTERGGLLVAARSVGRHSVRIEVWDTGVGIPADSLHEVFLEYYQIGNVSRADDEGLGLGLSIVKGLCDTLGYPLSARSRHTRGSVFTVTVPRAWHVSAAEHAAAPRPDQEGNARLLLIDDDKRVLGATRQLLGSRGYETRIAESRDEALAILDKGYRPEVVICDYRLGDGMSGTTVLDEIRDRFGSDIVGVLITADTDPQRLIDARDSGYRLLHKPLSATALRNTLAMLHAGEPADSGSSGQAEPAWRRARR